MMKNSFFVFDVESLGLFGVPFAVGWVVWEHGKEVEADYAAYNPNYLVGYEDNLWVRTNVLPHLEFKRVSLVEVMRDFMERWSYWQEQGAIMAADCPYPVEYRFLRACYDFGDLTNMTRENSPYPLIDVASVFLATGQDPIATYPRQEDELPAHHPLKDARQSARLLWECLAEHRPVGL